MADTLAAADKEFLEKCEEQLKDRYTDKDEEFMKVFGAEPSTPPIIESWWVPNNANRRNDRRSNRRNHPYERYGNQGRDNQDRRDNYSRGYNDYSRRHDNRDQGHYQRPRYYQ